MELSDLAGKKIGVIGGTTNEKAVNDALKRRVINATVVPLKTREEGLQQVESGAIDAFASDRVLLVGGGQAKDAKTLTLLTEGLSFEPYAIVLPRGDWQMRLAVNSALAQIYRSRRLLKFTTAGLVQSAAGSLDTDGLHVRCVAE